MTPRTLADQKLKEEIELLKLRQQAEEHKVWKGLRSQAEEVSSADSCRVYYFWSSVDWRSTEACLACLERWHRERPEGPITLVLNSPGGNVIAGLGLFDGIESLKGSHRVTVVVRGMAASMGGILLQAGHERVVGKSSHMLIHQTSTAAVGKISELEDEVEFCKKHLQKRLLEILSERSTLSIKEISRRWDRRDWWLNADEMVKYGFADRIG